ncbi:hypothetical protein ACOMHN_002375 [Nucella lapillus]
MAWRCRLLQTKSSRIFSTQLGQWRVKYCTDSVDWPVVRVPEVERFIVDCMTKAGTRPAHAKSLAQNLVAADHRGHYSHGLNRLDMYVHDISTGMTVSDCEPQIISERAATAHVDGRNLLGPVVGDFCMALAIHKAKTAGIGLVSAKNSNHYGIAGWYAMQASQQGLLGMSMTNTSPLSVPTRAQKPVLGTNPLSLAAPAKPGDDFVLDMATTTVALGKIELHDRKGIRIPNSWGVDSKGKESNDPQVVIEGGGLMPLGGTEMTGGYKGYGLAMLVEILCGILADADYGPNIRKWRNTDRIANLGQCFVAIDPESFAPGFCDRMADLMETCRSMPAAEGEDSVLVAGDLERQHIQLCDTRGGIPYHPNQIQFGEGHTLPPNQIQFGVSTDQEGHTLPPNQIQFGVSTDQEGHTLPPNQIQFGVSTDQEGHTLPPNQIQFGVSTDQEGHTLPPNQIQFGVSTDQEGHTLPPNQIQFGVSTDQEGHTLPPNQIQFGVSTDQEGHTLPPNQIQFGVSTDQEGHTLPPNQIQFGVSTDQEGHTLPPNQIQFGVSTDQEGHTLPPNQIQFGEELAQKLGVTPMTTS